MLEWGSQAPRPLFGLGIPQPFPKPQDEPIFGLCEGERVAGFEIKAVLKEGAVTEVYRALDERSGREVILKRLAPEADAEDHALFKREVAILQSLDHPRIPKATSLFEAAGSMAFALEKMPGETLKQALDRRGAYSRSEAYGVLKDVLEILVYLHGQAPAVIHRDLKPQNLLAGPQGVVVLDFGIATRGTRSKREVPVADLTRAHTMGYAPPEQAIGLEAFPQSDLYALAATVLYLWTGEHPIRHWEASTGRMQPPEGLEAGLRGLLNWMLAPAVGDRCPSAGVALQHLLGLPPV